ncbi:LLM class flavin-dependent oxidoreductase [Virgibacillus sp. C22-A2]|uniref:LLM class flavin-dependent oxidoreductase n=1 Tax=Virgibacillus tibetensis TaxID=3042313 RepID=A0ABU6KIE8_9BACI|nr:LLM class flavin-dependent oxidoreductase [Virgibacillus sp. C22-A2]
MKLSILDQSPIPYGKTAEESLSASIELAKMADTLGYKRYWIAEHHDMSGLACPAPDIMLSRIGAETENIRIGAGAVLLLHYRPYNIAERYNMLAVLYPDRVDLGIGRAPGGSAEATIALSGNFLENVSKMPETLDELLSFFEGNFPKDHMYSAINPSPVPKVSPEPWLLGTSEKSGILAAEKGIPYAFGHFMSEQDGPEIVKRYHANTKSGKSLVAVSVICAETTKEAEELALSSQLWKIQQAKGEGKKGVPTVEEARAYNFSDEKKNDKIIAGNSGVVKQELEVLQEKYQTDEFMIVTITHSFEARRKSYELIAKAFGL